MRSWTYSSTHRLGVALLTAAAAIASPPAHSAARSPAAKVPVVAIDAPGEIADGPKRTARMRVFDSQGRAVYSGRIGIELRGHSSLDPPKKSYAVETRKHSGKNRDVSLLGMPKDEDWVLIASYKDESLLRNFVAYSAARWVGQYASRAQLVEVRVNGSYQGVYLLGEQLKLHDDRVAVDDSDVSGGYLLEMTSMERTKPKQSFFTTPVQEQPIVYVHPDGDALSLGRAVWIRDYVNRFERALYGEQFRHRRRGYRRYLDIDAAVDYVLLNELFRNADTFRNSTHMHKSAGQKLVLGPVWDFDHALGNDPDPDFDALEGWQYQTRASYRWVDRLYADPAFRTRMARRWEDLRRRGLIRYITRTIDRGARQVAEAQARNFSRWPVFGTSAAEPADPRTGAPPANYAQAVDYLKWWLGRRAKWITRNVKTLTP